MLEHTVIWSQDVGVQGEIRIAQLDGKFYLYLFNWKTGQIREGIEFARNTDDGIRYVGVPYRHRSSAVRAAKKRVALYKYYSQPGCDAGAERKIK